jgi:hypothetical protein
MQYVECEQFPRFLSSGLLTDEVINHIETEKRIGVTRVNAPATSSSSSSGGTSVEKESSRCLGMRAARRGSVSLSIGEGPPDLSSLSKILSFQTSTKFFRDFCNRTFCAENLYFYLDTEHFQLLPSSSFKRRIALKIYNKYIDDCSVMQVNISSVARAEIVRGLQENGDDVPRNLFRSAQAEIFKLLQQDVAPKFVQSSEYKVLLQLLG